MSTATATLPIMLTPPAVAKRYGVKPERILGWIRSGEIRAIDVSSKGSKRPRFRIDPKDLEVFELRRSVVPAKKPSRRRRQQADVTEYF
ncbi:MAG: helix-turn-helix domain-containing protein [Candidatus Nealsonbacteria bacterium]|nr:helix-turn-helix domain-containing protein [Candidatus Nealsonbacteria bacterium]